MRTPRGSDYNTPCGSNEYNQHPMSYKAVEEGEMFFMLLESINNGFISYRMSSLKLMQNIYPAFCTLMLQSEVFGKIKGKKINSVEY